MKSKNNTDVNIVLYCCGFNPIVDVNNKMSLYKDIFRGIKIDKIDENYGFISSVEFTKKFSSFLETLAE